MFFKARAKDKSGEDALINSDNITYILPSLDGGSIIYFGDQILVSLDSLETINAKLTPAQLTVHTTGYITKSPDYSIAPQSSVDDGLPAHLPRLANGSVDKRTVAYKEYAASLTVVEGSSR